MAFPIIPILTPILGIFGDWLKGRREIARAVTEGKIETTRAVTQANIRLAETQQEIDNDWNKASISNSGWRDEWFTILLSIPMVMCFVPGGAPYVADGFSALREHTPDWYQYAFLVAVASSFGFKKLTDIVGRKK